MNHDINYFIDMEPMRYYNNETNNDKRQAMLENRNNEYIASEKKDGDWALLLHFNKNKNLIRSRSISKVTGAYGDYTPKLPHLVEEMNNWPDNTAVLAEICWDENGTTANSVGTILRCLPAKAIERQKDKKLKAVIFDILMVNSVDYINIAYIDRIKEMNNTYFHQTYIYPTTFYTSDFEETADRIINQGGEGLVIQRKDNPYMPGTRTAWKTLKLKQQLPEMELKVVGVVEPKKYYEGDCPDTWEYRINELHEDGSKKEILVTKPYYYDWKNGVTVEMPDGTLCDVTSGLTDEDREWLACDNAAAMIANGELYAVVKAMSLNSRGRLRHPSLVRLRNDM